MTFLVKLSPYNPPKLLLSWLKHAVDSNTMGNSPSSCLTYGLLLPWHPLFCLPGHLSFWGTHPTPLQGLLSHLPNPLHFLDPCSVGSAWSLGLPLFSFPPKQSHVYSYLKKDHLDMDVSPNSIFNPDLILELQTWRTTGYSAPACGHLAGNLHLEHPKPISQSVFHAPSSGFASA